MKKIIFPIAAALTCVMAANTVLAANAFSDVSESRYDWCVEHIENMAKAGYINGYEDGTFKPDNQVTKLEGIALLARTTGCNEEANKELLTLAHTQYDSAVTTSSLSWGQDEIVYLMYKGALNAADLTTYINGDAKNKALTRGEAAVLITKALEGDVKSSGGVDLNYNDKNSIPTNILPYVQYVTDQGIMNGIDDAFQPAGTVTRAQLAVMLDRICQKYNFSYYKGTLERLDKDNSLVTLNLIGKSQKEYTLNNNLKCTIKGSTAAYEDMVNNLPVVAKFVENELVALDAITDQPNEQLTVIYSGQIKTGDVIQIKVKNSETSTNVRNFNCSNNVSVTYQGSPANLNNLKIGDTVTLTVENGEVVSIVAAEKAQTITGATVSSVDIDEAEGIAYMTISSSDSNYNGKQYKISSNCRVTKNNKETDASSLYVGDRVTLTVKYNEITAVEASSSLSTATGTLVSLKIASQPEIVINVDGKEKTYQIPQDCEVYVNQKEGTLYDFRVGDSLTVTTNSSAVTKIQCSTSVINTSGNISGVVTAVNTSYGFVSIMTDSSNVPITVFCRDNTATFIDSKGKSVKMSSIKTGDIVDCRGTTTNGAFVATLVIVSASD